MKAELPSGKVSTAWSTAADLQVQPFNHIVGTDLGLMLAGKIAVGQRFPDAVLHLLGGLPQLHRVQFGNNRFDLFGEAVLFFCAWVAWSILAAILTLDLGTTEKTLR